MQRWFFPGAAKNRQDFSAVRRAYAERSVVVSAVPVCATAAENATKSISTGAPKTPPKTRSAWILGSGPKNDPHRRPQNRAGA
jgi:hypothetical protein